MPLAPVIFQDDLLNCSTSISSARSSCKKLNLLLNQRALKLNEEKSVCVIMASKGSRKKISQELQNNPLKCGRVTIEEKLVHKWLGQYISSEGLSASVDETVAAREGKIRGACLEIAQIVNDWRSQAVGGMESALLLWEACCLPSLLNGAGTWVEISPKTEEKLNALQRWFVRLIYQVGPGAPLSSLLWDTALLDVGLLIWREKLMMVIHIRCLAEGSLAHWLNKEQVCNIWPGLASEMEEICTKLQIENCKSTKLNKKDYRQVITDACHKMNELRLRAQAKGKEKCDRIMSENYGKKSYIGRKLISDVRQFYRSRVGMQPFAGNYSKCKTYEKTDYLCRCQEDRETESHLMSGKCKFYNDIREKYDDFSSDEELVSFFPEVLERRDEIDQELDKED